MVRILLLAHRFRGEDPPKKSSLQNLRLCHNFNTFFVLERKFSYACGHRQYSGGAQAPKCTTVAPGLLLSFGAQSSLGGGHIYHLGCTSSDLGGVRPRNAPRGAGLVANQSCKSSGAFRVGFGLKVDEMSGFIWLDI